MNELFSLEERRDSGSCPNEGDICSSGVQPLGLENWDSSLNYSRLYFDVYQPAEAIRPDAYDPSSVTVRAFAEEDCPDGNEVPWYQWGNCNTTENACQQVEKNIVSVSITQTSDMDEAEDGCQIAAYRGGVSSDRRVERKIVVGAVLVLGLMHFM